MKSTQPAVTILVPMHNSQQFLSRCLASLQAQSLLNLEILCLDDGSTDDSVKIARLFARQDKRFKIIKCKHLDFSAIINQGISLAHGEYLGFVDNRDWVEPEMAAYLYARAHKYQVDLITSNGYWEQFDDQKHQRQLLPLQTLQTNLAFEWREQLMLPPTTLYTALYRTQFLRHHLFQFSSLAKNCSCDTTFALAAFGEAEKICLVQRIFYHHCLQPHSAAINRKQAQSVLKEYRALTKRWQQQQQLTRFAAVLTASKYRVYQWCAGHLPLSAAQDFLRQAQNDLLTQKQAGYLQTRLLTHFFARLDLWLLMYYPTLYAYKAKFTS